MCTSYLTDSSGRSKLLLPLQLACPTKEDADFIVESGCLPGEQFAPGGREDDDAALRFEVTSLSSPLSNMVVTVEDVSVVSCEAQGNSILLEAELVVRAFESEKEMDSRDAFRQSIINEAEIVQVTSEEQKENDTKCQLEVTAVLVTSKQKPAPPKATASSPDIPAGLAAMQLGGSVIPLAEQSPTLQTRLKPFFVDLTLTQAMKITARTVPGSSSGSTLVSLTMMHSNTHSEAVIINNIALHPGHSRSTSLLVEGFQSMPGGQNIVKDMAKCVKWGFGSNTEPKLPLTIYPHEAYSTVLTIEAGEDLISRTFVSPISVTARAGGTTVVESTDATWTTGRIALEPADAFRIDMSLQNGSDCHVGKPLVVSLKVLNLSSETRDLMLLMAKDEEKAGSIATPKHGSVNTAVVSEVNGYTFGVWGLSGDDDGTTRHNRDHELLAVDAALLLGEVKGQHSVDAELRFVPLREGTLDVPNLKLYDKTEGKWYNCMHMLKIVAAAKQEQ